MKTFIQYFTIFLLFCFSATLNAQEDAPERIPEYEVPYEFPTVEGVKEVLDRVRVY